MYSEMHPRPDAGRGAPAGRRLTPAAHGDAPAPRTPFRRRQRQTSQPVRRPCGRSDDIRPALKYSEESRCFSNIATVSHNNLKIVEATLQKQGKTGHLPTQGRTSI